MDNWQEITSEREILTTAKGATIEFDAPPHYVSQPHINFSSKETDVINNEIDKLLHGEVLSSIFIRPKKMVAIDSSSISKVLTIMSHITTLKWAPFIPC